MGDVLPMHPAPPTPLGTRATGGGTRTLTAHEHADREQYVQHLDDMIETAHAAMRCDCADLGAVGDLLDVLRRLVRDAQRWEGTRC